ncbi:unnamed protein product [Taenia asiatica]|uniref:Fibronectin type-III domain-containing protein n=1 Tax=Taenia asiatica TaxID=60517 RepID=A0A0R3VY99_TAEAS|nr:unnamed protein product [Taenia asiatica]
MASHRDFILADDDVPQNVKMKPIDSNTVNMTWDAPRISNSHVTGYHILWKRDDGKNGSVNADLSGTHVFTDLEPGRTISAIVAAVIQKNDSTTPKYIGNYSKRVSAVAPYSIGGKSTRLNENYSMEMRPISTQMGLQLNPLDHTEII